MRRRAFSSSHDIAHRHRRPRALRSRARLLRATPLLAALLGLGLNVSPAGAQTAATASTAASDRVLPTIEVSSPHGERHLPVIGARNAITLSPAAQPAASTVIDNAELQTINVGRDISNLFRRVPGVLANSIDQGDTGNGFRMRGFATQGTHGADTAVYVDGVPQNLPSSEAGAGHGPAFLEWLTPDMIDHLTVVKGPISALYGDQHRAGAVDIVTAGRDTPSSLGLSVERYGGKRASLVAAKDFGAVHSLLVADLYRSDSFRKQADNRRDNVFWKLSAPHQGGLYSLSLNRYHGKYHAAGYLSYDRLRQGLIRPDDVQENARPGFGENTQTGLVFNRRPLDGDDGVHATLYVLDINRERGITAGGALHNVGSDDRSVVGGRLAQHFAITPAAGVFAGVEFRRDKGDGIRQRYDDGAATGQYLVNLDMDLLTYGLFTQGQYRFAQHWKAQAGLRYDVFDYDIDNHKLPDASTGYRDGVFTPKLGIAWTALPTLDLFANVAEGFRSPSAQQISPSGALGPLGAPGGFANTHISPSKVRSWDLGFTALPLASLSLAGTAYYIENEDEIMLTAPDTYSSMGETTRKGFELEARYAASEAFSAYASYGRITEARLRNPAAGTGPLLAVPRHTAKAGVQYRQPLGGGRLTVNADAFVIAQAPYYSGSPLLRRDMPTYTRYDLRLTYDYQRYQFSAYWTHQPHRLASESAYATTAGLQISPQPANLGGVSVRYFF